MGIPNKDRQRATLGSFENNLRARSWQRRNTLIRSAAQAEPPLRNDIISYLELVQIAIKDLSMPRRNVRKAEEPHLRELMNSIATFGYCAPLIVDQDNAILDGVLRFEAARRMHIHTIACVRVGHLACTRFRRHRVRCFDGAGGGSWRDGSLRESSSSRRYA
jgi:hypothetical protein